MIRKRTRLPCLAAAALLGFAAPAAAQEGPYTRWGQGGALDRYESPANGWGPAARWLEMDRGSREAFARGYRAGRMEERQRRYASVAWNNRAQGEAYARLERAAMNLRRALVLMRRYGDPDQHAVAAALRQAREALERTQNAMTWLPPRPDQSPYEMRSGRSIGAENASGGWAS